MKATAGFTIDATSPLRTPPATREVGAFSSYISPFAFTTRKQIRSGLSEEDTWFVRIGASVMIQRSGLFIWFRSETEPGLLNVGEVSL